MVSSTPAAPEIPQGLPLSGADFNAMMQMYASGSGSGSASGSAEANGGGQVGQGAEVQTRSGRISRPPPPPPPSKGGHLDAAQATAAAHALQNGDKPQPPEPQGGVAEPPKRGRGRPKLPEEDRLSRQRARNKNSAHMSRQRRKKEEDEMRSELESRRRECKELEDRCHELEAQVRELQAALQAHGLPLPSVPGPIRGRRAYWAPPADTAYPMLQPQPQAQPQAQHQHQQDAHNHAQAQPYPMYAGGLEALANAALPNLQPPSMPVQGVSPMNASAIGDLTTPLHTATPVTPAVPMDPDIAAALDVLNFPAYNWRPYDDDTISLSALFTLDDLGEDANDTDFVPPTSPKGESSDSESDGEGEGEGEADAETPRDKGRTRRAAEAEDEERAHKRQKVAAEAPATPETPDDEEPEEEAEDEPEDLFLPIEDVPIPEDQLYADAMAALGVSTPAELVVVVSKIVETASRGGVTPEQVEGLRRLMRLAEARHQGASRSGSGGGGGSGSGGGEASRSESAGQGSGRERERRDGERRR